jgi:mycoredoxin
VSTDQQAIKVFGTTWCGDCHRAQHVLEARKASYVWIDIEKDKAAYDHVIAVVGKRKVPLIELPDGSYLVEPSNAALEAKLDELRQTSAP